MIKKGLYNLLGSSIKLIVNVLSVPILIRVLGLETYGLLAIISSLLSIIILAEGGLSNSTLYFLSKAISEKDKNYTSEVISISSTLMLLIATVTLIVVFTISRWIAPYFLDLDITNIVIDNNNIQKILICMQVGSLILWLRMLQGILVAIEMAYGKYGVMNTINTISAIGTSTGMIGIAFWKQSILLMIVWQLCISFVAFLAHLYTSISLLLKEQIRFQWSRNSVKEITMYSLFTWLSAVGGALFQQGDKLIVGSILDVKTLGVYSAITNTCSQINSLSGILSQPILPRVRSLVSQKTAYSSIKREISKSVYFNASVTFGLGTLLFINDALITNLLFSSDFSYSYLYSFRIAILIYCAFSLNAVGHYIILGVGAASLSLKASLTSGIISLILIYAGCLHYGLAGAILGNSGFILTLILNYWGFQKCNLGFLNWFVWLTPSLGISVLICSIKLALHSESIVSSVMFSILCVLGNIFLLKNKVYGHA